MMKQFYFFVRSHMYEIIVIILELALAWTGFVYKDESIFLIASSFTFFVLLLVIIYLRTRERPLYYLPMSKIKSNEDWIGQGIWQFTKTDRCFEISQSESGYIYPKTLLWDDYSVEFNFKIIKRYIGCILRAINLSNYVMLQFGVEGINPHVKLNGMWYPKKHDDPDVDLSFQGGLSQDKWYYCKLICHHKKIRIIIKNDQELIIDRHWVIPPHVFVQYIDKEYKTEAEKIKNTKTILLPADLDYGTFGFRSSGDEKGLIKDILIKKI